MYHNEVKGEDVSQVICMGVSTTIVVSRGCVNGMIKRKEEGSRSFLRRG